MNRGLLHKEIRNVVRDILSCLVLSLFIFIISTILDFSNTSIDFYDNSVTLYHIRAIIELHLLYNLESQLSNLKH